MHSFKEVISPLEPSVEAGRTDCHMQKEEAATLRLSRLSVILGAIMGFIVLPGKKCHPVWLQESCGS